MTFQEFLLLGIFPFIKKIDSCDWLINLYTQDDRNY